ncbi:hypothetical protein LO772_11150 [Yinghuangia sp. ASG 101]|uniref:hypothetical protein n=1 Tax=Yinghuangia sp. ASG 101 TaxID=2896848 RepID=UPI001E4CDCB3|nr:hypothetical protein [Yinghuangia sp. ASG 101]UGQ14100.1 hypothetical protein LO772_11150 [Yinghuangia sp. ASG 101]
MESPSAAIDAGFGYGPVGRADVLGAAGVPGAVVVGAAGVVGAAVAPAGEGGTVAGAWGAPLVPGACVGTNMSAADRS